MQECIPSMVTDRYWLMAYSRNPSAVRPGKWLIFVPVSKIDEAWEFVRTATEDGMLGPMSKVSTARQNPNARSEKEKVICVYTYDHEDEEDVMRVREELRNLGFNRKIPYKTDEATNAGLYRTKGNARISKYYE